MRVLFVQPSLQPPGGGNGVAAWMVQGLKDRHDVTVFTWTRFDLEPINRFWGTTIGPGEVRGRRVPAPIRWGVDAVPLPLSLLRTSIMLRLARRLGGHDVAATANNEADFRAAGVQYVHFPWNLFPRPLVDLRWYHLKPLLALYYRLCAAVSGFRPESVARNVTLVNSDWTGRHVQRRYGIATTTVYPPVTATFPDVPWEARENAFVCIGRISPEKDIERIVAIVAAVRSEVPGVRLRIVGTPGHRPYYRRIVRLARAHADWVSLHENLSRAELVALIARHRYGLHGMREEHFGMVVAEMVRAGCIVWVPRGGGQVEIVGDDRLLYDTVEGAAAAIVKTLRDPAEQAALRAHLAARAALFSTDRFMAEIHAAVETAAGRARWPLRNDPG